MKATKTNYFNKHLLISLRIIVYLLLTAISVSSYAQNVNSISRTVTAFDSLRSKYSIEKLYVQLDKPYYTTGDTIWLKAYLFDAAYLRAAKSGLLYIELANDSNKVVKRMMLPAIKGISYGNIALGENNIPEGAYTLRAYTNWMRNFGEDYVFKKALSIVNTGNEAWLVRSRLRQLSQKYIAMTLQFNKLDKQPVGLREIKLQVLEGRKTLFKGDAETTADGSLDVNFTLPEKTDIKNIALVAEDLRKGEGNRKLVIPVILNRAENVDLQFMPEGGNMVAGIRTRIAFKAIGEDGKGADVSGRIYDSSALEVASFTTTHKGMGSFELLPAINEKYTARVLLPDGTSRTYPLPPVKLAGTVLTVTDTRENDSLQVTVSSRGIQYAGSSYYLVAQSRGTICYGARINFREDSCTINIPRQAFPSGITRFTLLNDARQSLNERIVYINHDDNLQISITTHKPAYTKRDSIALQVAVTDKYGKPVQGNFSLAVTDDAQIKDNAATANIISSLLLTSDLKGHIEDPAYYIQPGDQVRQDLDHLLLTQGWVGYDWQDVFQPVNSPKYKQETQYTVKGKVINTFSKPVANSGVSLLAKRSGSIMDTVTNADGQFIFNDIFPVEKEAFFIQARNKGGKSFNVGIEVEEFNPPEFTSFPQRLTPWYINSDTLQLNRIRTTRLSKAEQDKLTAGSRVLKEVTVTAKKIIRESKNLNGPGEADLVLDEKDMEKAGKMTLGELLKDRIEGFGMRYYKSFPFLFCMIGSARVHFFIDGVDAENYGIEKLTQPFLDYYTAEDIKGIEVMSSVKYRVRYDPNVIVKEVGGLGMPPPPMFLEITTRTGEGPFMKKTPGTYLYKPLAFSLPKQFYRPRYVIKDPSPSTVDLRSTIHWQPEIITGQDGKAIVSFYATDRVGNYTVMLEGTDMRGNLGVQRAKIKVEK